MKIKGEIMLYRLVYASSASQKFSEQELVELLEVSRKNNKPFDVTGILLYRDGNFIQVLEGTRENVETIYGYINADERHKGVMLVVKEDVEDRLFPNWSMGFEDLSNSTDARKLEGYNTFFDNDRSALEKMRENPDRVWVLLNSFQEITR